MQSREGDLGDRRSFLTDHVVEWMVKEGVVCKSCEEKEKKCFWRMEVGRGKACLAHTFQSNVLD